MWVRHCPFPDSPTPTPKLDGPFIWSIGHRAIHHSMVRAAAQTKREVESYFHCRRPRSITLNNILPTCSTLSHSILFWAHATVNTMGSVLLRPIGGLITFARLYMRSSLTWIVVRVNVSLVFDIYLHTRAAYWRLWNCKDWNNILN